MSSNLALDASSPAVVNTATATTSSAAFSPPAWSLLVAATWGDSNNGSLTEAQTVASTGGLSWLLRQRANGSPGATVELWYAFSPSAPGSITVSLTDNQGSVDKRLWVGVFTDKIRGMPAGIGAVTFGASSNLSYTSMAAGSWGWMAGMAGGGATTAGSAQTVQDSNTAFDTGDGTYLIKQNALSGAAGTTVNMSCTPSGSVSHGIAFEVLPALSPLALVNQVAMNRSFNW